jgi:GTP-binding protein EngB required for normal cell division
MARLSERLGEWLSRAEILARGAEGHRLDAVRALDTGKPWEARAHALELLDEVPSSRVALALWADAAESMFLDNEVCEALERLVVLIPFRADAWLRLATARSRLGLDPAKALAQAVEAREPAQYADAARMWLCDIDLLAGDAARAERWLEQLSLGSRQSPDALLRRVETALDRGDVARARSLTRDLPEPPAADGRGWLIRARLLADEGADPTRAFSRALFLDAPGAERAAVAYLSQVKNADHRAKLRQVVESLGRASQPLWRSAFALAEGRATDALPALADAARADAVFADRYLAHALEARSEADFQRAVALLEENGRPLAKGVATLAKALRAETDPERLSLLDEADGVAGAWAEALREATFRRLCQSPVDFASLLVEFSFLARELGELSLLGSAESVARDLERPLRVAIVGEFNAGKSSLINALLGDDVAPTGVLPTTATINHLVWAPDRFVRIERRDGADDRVVPHQKLGEALREIPPDLVERVTIYAPLELLRKLELVDTPGFNAPDSSHSRTARTAFRDAHVVLWLLDATQPLKATERDEIDGIRARNLPLFVLLNKIDRLPDAAALKDAVAHVEAGLTEAGLCTEAPLIPLSARLARSGAEGSGFDRVEALVNDVLMAKSVLLRERALVARLESVARGLLAAAETRDARGEERTRRDRERRVAWQERALELNARRPDRLRQLERSIAELRGDLAREIAPVQGMLEDASARRFVADRARRVVGHALAERLIELSGLREDSDALKQLEPRIESAAAALAARFLDASAGAELDRDLAELGLEELGRVLASGGPPPPTSAPLSPRARTLGRVLGEWLNGQPARSVQHARIPT